MVAITLAAISGTVSVLNGIFTLGQWFYKLHGVPEDVKRAVTDLASIQKDLNDARILRSLKFDMSSPERKSNRIYCRLNDAIKKLEATVRECSKTLRASDVDLEIKGDVTIANRFEWVLNGKDTFVARQPFLIIDHGRLMSVMSGLEALPDVSPAPPELLAPPPYSATMSTSEDYLESLSPSQRRAMRGKSVELIEEDETGEITASQNAAEPDLFNSSNTTISRKMRKLWPEDSSSSQVHVHFEAIDHEVEDEYVTSRHHRKRHRK